MMRALVRMPTLRELTKWLRELNEAYGHPEAGPEYVVLYCDLGRTPAWFVASVGCQDRDPRFNVGWELVPGKPEFDAVAAARRMRSLLRERWRALESLEASSRAMRS